MEGPGRTRARDGAVEKELTARGRHWLPPRRDAEREPAADGNFTVARPATDRK